jgi:hypothetical protein
MNMTSQAQVTATPLQFSEAEMKRYFSTIPRSAIIIAIVGAVLLLLGLIAQTVALILVGLIVALIGGGIIVSASAGRKPTDQQYDIWLKSQAKAIADRAIMKLGLDQSEITNEPLEVHGFVLPGMKDSNRYRADEPRWKKGNDGLIRFSVNTYTFFFPEEHHLAAFVGDVNALNQTAHNEKTEEYFYRDIVGATTSDEQDNITIKGKQYQYRTQRFSLRITSGDSIGVSIDAVPIDNRQNIPSFKIPNSGIDRTVAQLRMLLRAKKQGSM